MANNLESKLSININGFVKGLKSSTARLKSWARNAGNSIKKVAKAFASIGKKAGIAGLGLALTAALAPLIAFRKAADGLAESMDKVGKLSSNLGVGTEFLQGIQIQAQRAGLEVSNIEQIFRRLIRSADAASKGTGSVAESYQKLGVDVRNSNGQFKQADELFLEVGEALRNVRNDTERAAISMKIFGRNGADLAVLFAGGRGELEAFTKKAKELGLLIDEDLIRATEKLNDELALQQQLTSAAAAKGVPAVRKLQIVWEKFRRVLVEIGAKYMPAIVKAVEAMGDAFNNNSGKINEILGYLVDKLFDIGDVILGLPEKVTTVFNFIIARAQDVTNAFIELRNSIPFNGDDKSLANFSNAMAELSADQIAKIRKMQQGWKDLRKDSDEYLKNNRFTVDTSTDSTITPTATASRFTGDPDSTGVLPVASDNKSSSSGPASDAHVKAFEDRKVAAYALADSLKPATEQLQIQYEKNKEILEGLDDQAAKEEALIELQQQYNEKVEELDLQAFQEEYGTLINLGEQFADSLGSALAESITEGEDAFKAFAQTFLKQIAIMITRALVLAAINAATGGAGGFAGAFASSLSGGAHATGGFIPPNSTALVGENGPELVRTGTSGGTVTPNAEGAGGVTVMVNNSGAPKNVDASYDTDKRVINIIMNDLNRGGQLSRVINTRK